MTVITPLGSVGEKELSRAIQLELEKLGSSAEISENDAETKIFVMKILDEKAADIIKRSKAENKICCFFENTVPVPEDTAAAVRPFMLKSLCGRIVKQPRTLKENTDSDLEVENGSVMFCGEKVSLSKKEFELFSLLYENRGKAVSREKISRKLWGGSDTNVSDVYVRYLRKKLDERFDKKLIVTVRNEGYMLR